MAAAVCRRFTGGGTPMAHSGAALGALALGLLAGVAVHGRLDRRRVRTDAGGGGRPLPAFGASRGDRHSLEAILEHSPIVIYVKDLAGRHTLVSRGCADAMGRSVPEVLGRTDEELLGSAGAALQVADAQVARRRQATEFEECVPRDGEEHYYHSTKFPIVGRSGEVIGVGGVSVEITARRRAEQQLRIASEEARRANRAKSEFLSRMSHELRTPLNSVVGFSQLLGFGDLTADQDDAVHHIERAGRHLVKLVDEVLDIARAESGSMALSLEPVHVAEVVDHVLGLLRPLAAEHAVTIVVDGGRTDAVVQADRQRLLQVLLNLVSNAVKYNRRGGQVRVRWSADDEELELSVVDTGPGLTEGQLTRVFEPFERLGAEQTDVEGTGVGLTLVRRLLELMGGAIQVTSTPGTGSTFTATLRTGAPGDLETVPAPAPAPAAERTAAADLSGVRVLLVEDNLPNVHLVERALQLLGDVTVLPAMSVALAVDLARQHQPHVVLLDVHLPDGDAADVLAQLRSDGRTASIPVVIVSADATRRQMDRLLAAGAVEYLTKPIDVDRLLTVVQDVVLATEGWQEDADVPR